MSRSLGPMEYLLAQPYWKQDNPVEGWVVAAIFGVIVAALLLYNFVRKAMSDEPQAKPSRQAPSFSKGAFRRKAEAMGFSDAEASFLEYYARVLGMTSPQAVFGTRAQVDAFMRNAFKYIENHAETEEAAQEQKGRLFAIREALALRLSSGSSIRSTRQLQSRTPLSLVTAKGAHYSSILALNEQRALYAEPALDAFGQPIRFPRGSRITVYFYTGNHVGYGFPSRSGGIVDMDGKPLLALAHSDKIKQLPSRRHQRREARVSCRFFLVHVRAAKDRGKLVKTVQVERAAVAGIIVDVSAGGLSMQTVSPANAGDFLKLEFDLGSGTRAVYATVVRTSRTRGGALMHLKFVKIAPKTANEIQAYVYGYE